MSHLSKPRGPLYCCWRGWNDEKTECGAPIPVATHAKQAACLIHSIAMREKRMKDKQKQARERKRRVKP